MTIVILGGTAEAAVLAARLHDRGITVITSLAGRTREPLPVSGQTRTGGFGGADGLAAYLRAHHIALVVDMTHPFATQISANARKACETTRVKLIAWHRPAWERRDGDQWTEVPDIPAAVTAVPSGARALLALGSQHIAPFVIRADVHFLVRMVDQPAAPLPLPDQELLLARPGSVEEEYALLRTRGITHIICRNSGGKASYCKIAAARLLGLQVIMIGRNSVSANAQDLGSIESQVLAHLAQQSSTL